MGLIRKSKSDNKLSMKAEISTATIKGPENLKLLAKDFQGVGRITELKFVVDEVVSVENLEFAPEQD